MSWRGSQTLRPAPDGTEMFKADMRDTASVRAALGNRMFDVVVDFISFTADQVAADIELFTGRTGQYVFISSASAYQKPPARLPILESTPLRNPFWQYSRVSSYMKAFTTLDKKPERLNWVSADAKIDPRSPTRRRGWGRSGRSGPGRWPGG
jgi:UDP-glucose 4-epimerase